MVYATEMDISKKEKLEFSIEESTRTTKSAGLGKSTITMGWFMLATFKITSGMDMVSFLKMAKLSIKDIGSMIAKLMIKISILGLITQLLKRGPSLISSRLNKCFKGSSLYQNQFQDRIIG